MLMQILEKKQHIYFSSINFSQAISLNSVTCVLSLQKNSYILDGDISIGNKIHFI